jgi:uncharacterized protein YukE
MPDNNNKVIFPLTAVEAFSKTLGSYSQKLDECLKDMENAVKTLRDQWGDDKFSEFEREFKICTDKIKPLSEELARVKKHAQDVWSPIINEYLKRTIK